MSRPDTSALDMSYALRLANRGFDVDQIAAAIAAKPSRRRDPGSIKYMRLLESKGKDAADLYASRTAAAALKFATNNPMIRDRASAVERLLDVESAAAGLPWGTYAGAGARRALEGAFVVADRVGGVSFGLALREWAEIVGQDFEAIRSHRDTLTSLGWLKRNPNDRPGRTSRFTLRTPSHIHSHQGGLNVGLASDRAWLNHDAFRPGGVGDMGWLLLHTIAAPTDHLALALRTGLDEETLAEHVARLERLELIEVDDQTSRRRDDLQVALAVAAGRLGTLGALAAERGWHEQERDDWKNRRPDVNVGAAL